MNHPSDRLRLSCCARQPSSMACQTLSSAFSTPMPAPRWAGTPPTTLRIMCGRLALNAKSRQGSRKTAGQEQVASSHQHLTRPLKPTAESLDRAVPANPWGSTGNRRICFSLHNVDYRRYVGGGGSGPSPGLQCAATRAGTARSAAESIVFSDGLAENGA